jgi:hypothetical protein
MMLKNNVVLGEPTAWPHSSPDLSLPNFFVLSYMTNRVHVEHPRDIRELRDKLAAAFEQITPQV